MTLALTDFPRALVTIDDVLRVNDAKKQGEWERKPLADHLNHAVAHALAAQTMLADGAGPDERYRAHTFEEHVSHAGTRLLFVLELMQREATR